VSDPREEQTPPADEPPPFLGSWGRLYGAVLGILAALIALFFLFTRVFQ
jgi:uncharacterized membrane protein YccC